MKTILTEAKARVSDDTRARWTEIEKRISPEIERLLRGGVRHIVLGCTRCRQEEIAFYLVRGLRLLPGEAAMLMELLVDDYRMSTEGKRELKALGEGQQPFLPHDAVTEGPLLAGQGEMTKLVPVQLSATERAFETEANKEKRERSQAFVGKQVISKDNPAAISVPFATLPMQTVIDPNVPPLAVDYNAECPLEYHRLGDPGNARLEVRRLSRGVYRFAWPIKPTVPTPNSPTEQQQTLRFQQDEDRSGVTPEALLAVLFDRLCAVQVAEPHKATLAALRHVEMALNCLHERTLQKPVGKSPGEPTP